VNDGERLGRERRLAAQRPALPRQATDKGADAGKGSPSFLPLCGGMWGWCMSVGMQGVYGTQVEEMEKQNRERAGRLICSCRICGRRPALVSALAANRGSRQLLDSSRHEPDMF